jgi:hypothetical protein
MNPTSAWKIHKRCRILGMIKYSSEQDHWVPSAVILWKSGWEKHVAFLNPRDRFYEQNAALDHAMVFATEWCDAHFI